MHGYRHCEPQGRWAVGRYGRGRRGLGFGWRRGHDMDGDDMMRAGRRMLAQGDLRLIALALIAEQPRHGYDIMKALEEKTAGWYSPSPGIVYPALTYLEEVGYVTAQAEGAKKLYAITVDGQAHLDENRDLADAVLQRLAMVGEKVTRMRQRLDRDAPDDERNGMPPLVKAAINNLREVAAKRLADDAEAEAKIVEVLARAAQDLRKV